MKTITRKIVLFITFISVMILAKDMTVKAETAPQINANATFSNGNGDAVLDSNYNTDILMNAGESVTITLDEQASGVYIIWGQPVEKWTLNYGEKKETRGNNGFLHEYIEFETPVTEFTIVCDGGNTLTDIYCYGQGDLPEDVQVWEPMCEKADMLLISTHADDEILFFGGILPYYAGEMKYNIQVVYFSEYWTGAKIREHEKLDGLWHAGVRNYPFTGNFPDLYAEDLESAKNVFNVEDTIGFIVEMIRKFKPLVVVAQDENGEYGHGAHMLTSYATEEAVKISMDAARYADSATTYGVWDVPKTYLHLYGENQIVLDCRSPLTAFGGKTTLEVASESYKKHVSQQWCWFYVDDEYEYSCAKYGLYRTNVGVDTTNNMLENVVDYKTQAEEESQRLEEESIKESEAIAESESKEQESIEQAKEQERKDNEKKDSNKRIITILLVILAAIVLLGGTYLVLLMRAAKRRKLRKKRNSKRR